MNASMKVLTPEQKWHAGRQADAFFGLLDQYNQLLEEHNGAKVEIEALRKALDRLGSKLNEDDKRHTKNGRSGKATAANQPS